ncbi:hypothetical protein J4221_01625 [Candidatus Pacearchaeota archaeon]|nr:hypothetical protein [Candidatus Pacearchaeota archaeon]
MKKGMRRKLGLCFLLILLTSIFLVHAQIVKPNKKEYLQGDSVYVMSTISASDTLCRANTNEKVKLFIVSHRDSWGGGEVINDVRDSPSDVPNTRFSLEKVWDGSIAGKYDLIIDCNENNAYDSGEPLYGEGFSIIAKKALGSVSKFREMKELSWQYDPEELTLYKEMLSLKISVTNEDVSLKNISLQISGDKAFNIEALEIYNDNNDKVYTQDDSKIGEYQLENTTKNNIIINIEHTASKDSDNILFVVIKLKPETEKGNYNIELISLHGQGSLSNSLITFSGTPIKSSVQILDKKTCLGNVTFSLPSFVGQEEEVKATVSGFSGCDGKQVVIKSDFCYFPSSYDLASCTISGSGCDVSFKALNNDSLYVCIDKNSDGDYSDFSESKSYELIVAPKEQILVNETNKSDENETINVNSPVTGEIIRENNPVNEFLGGTNGIILIEVTLLLILFVLVMILFKLKGPVSISEFDATNAISDEEETEEKEEKKEKLRRK